MDGVPGVVAGTILTSSDGTAYLVRDWVDTPTLGTWFEQDVPLEERLAIAYWGEPSRAPSIALYYPFLTGLAILGISYVDRFLSGKEETSHSLQRVAGLLARVGSIKPIPGRWEREAGSWPRRRPSAHAIKGG